jgi:hypothetical protein
LKTKTIMKTKIGIFGLLMALSVPAGAAVYNFGTLNGDSPLGAIPDNNTLGLSESYTVSGLGSSLSDLSLTFVLQGGAATDLSGYLRLGNTVSSPAFDLTSLIQGTAEAPGGTTYTLDFNTPGFQTTFSGQNPNDAWTLFFADTVAGDTTTLNGWSLNLSASTVPEPASAALLAFGIVFIGVGSWRRFKRQRQSPSL